MTQAKLGPLAGVTVLDLSPGRSLRWARESDYETLGQVMFDAVRNGESRYTEKQRAAWTPEPRKGPAWTDRLSPQDVVVAEAGGEILGFMSLAAGGYLDFAFIRPRAQHSGLFRLLLGQIEARALETGATSLWTHASLTAEPAFAALGFEIRKREQVVLGGETFDRCEMEKRLLP